jgi:hypothetical protein
MTPDEILTDAEQEGYDAGKAAGSWLLDGNSTTENARRLLQGIEDGDPEIMDELPSAPLSGEWADGLLPRDVLAWYDMDDNDDAADDVLSAFENGYSRGVMDEAVRSAQAIIA